MVQGAAEEVLELWQRLRFKRPCVANTFLLALSESVQKIASRDAKRLTRAIAIATNDSNAAHSEINDPWDGEDDSPIRFADGTRPGDSRAPWDAFDDTRTPPPLAH